MGYYILVFQLLISGKPFKHITSTIQTADGKSPSISGFVKTVTSFREVEKDIQIFVIPSLSKDLFLGYDFCKLFDLMPLGELNSLQL